MIAEAVLSLAARLRAEPAEVEVGQVCRLVLEVEHPAGAAVRFPEVEPVPDDSWVLVAPRKIARPDAGRTLATWEVLSLEAGERELPRLQVDVGDAGGMRKIDVEAGKLSVRPALAAGEDAPRPMRGFRPPVEGAEGRRGRLALGGAILVALLAGAALLVRRARRKPAPALAPSPLDRLSGLQKEAAEDPGRYRPVVYGICRLLRGSIDAALREDRAALVDADWVARIEADERVPLGVRRSSARILHDSARIKYALHAPTRLALEEMLADARSALEALAAAPPPAQGEAA